MGRHFRLRPDLKVILGRIQEENERIRNLARPGQVLFNPQNFRGPTALAIGEIDEKAERIIGEMISAYSQDKTNTYLITKQVSTGETTLYAAATERLSRKNWDECRVG
jgi:hypothetical protein